MAGAAASHDPNEKFGAVGYGLQSYIPAGQAIPYRVNFENLGPGSVPTPTTPASAPAQRVEVTDQLSANLDWDTLAFTEFGFGDTVVTFDQPGAYQSVTVPMTYNDKTFDVEVEMSLDPATGLVRVVYQSIDPGTFLPPDVLTGFLPPEDGTGIGKGHFAYSVKPKAGLATGTAIRNVALISFDGQTIIATNQIDPQNPAAGTDPNKEALNTIDADAPTAGVTFLPSSSPAAVFPVQWAGSDPAGSGLDSYTVFVSTDGGPLTPWLTNTRDTGGTYVGTLNHTYGFAAIARDFAGNAQPFPTAAQATVRVGVTPTAADDAFAVTAGKLLSGNVMTNDVKGKLKLTAVVVTPPTEGTFSFTQATGAFKYTPPATGFGGRDFFTYKLTGPGVESNVARVDLAPHLAAFRLARVSVNEKAGTATLFIDLGAKATAAISLDYIVAPQTARPGGQDFTLANGTVNFAVGEKTKTFTVALANDLLDENNETLDVWLANPTGPVAIGKNRTATLTIIDDDASPKVSFRDKASAAGEGVSPDLEVFLSAPAGRPVTVNYATKNGTAKAGQDYTAATGMLTFAPGETSKLIPLSVLNDPADEPDETVIVMLSKPVSAVLSGIPTHTHTIRSDDPVRTVQFETSSAPVGEGGKTTTVAVVLSAAAPHPVTVTYALDLAGMTGTAKDVSLPTGTLTFKAGETRKVFVVRLNDDKEIEGAETVAVRLSSPMNAILGGADVFTLTITDNDL